MTDIKNHIHTTFPIDVKWLKFVKGYISLYASTVEFNPVLTEMIKHSVLEVCGELHERAKGINNVQSYDLTIASNDEEIDISVSYDNRIPLNPMKDREYEVPTEGSNTDQFSTDTLWLHLIKYRMDRVIFTIDGSKHTLKMIKYQRQQGKEKQVWVMGLKPRLKEGLNIDVNVDANSRGNFVGFIQDFKSDSVLRLGANEMHAAQKMDGETAIYDIYMDAVEQGMMVAPQIYINLYEALEAKNLLYKEENKRTTMLGRVKDLLKHLTFSVPHSDKLITKLHGVFKPLFSPLGVLLVILVGLSGLYPIFTQKEGMIADYQSSVDVLLNHWWVVILFYVINTAAVFIHELSHGICCKHYGGRVPRLGLTFYLSSFIWFCDTTSSYNFNSKLSRIMVSLAGPLSTFFLFGVFAWAYYFSTYEAFRLLWLVLIASSALGLIMNFNPFLRMDSYYILSDLVGINNLRAKTFGALESRIRKFFGMSYTHYDIPQNKRKWLMVYAVVGVAATSMFFIIPIYRYINYLLGDGDPYIKILWGGFIVLFVGFSLTSSITSKIKSLRHQVHKLK